MIDTAMTARTARPLRFGLNMLFSKSVAQYVQSAPRAADIGFDVVLVGDHLGHQSPLSTLVAIAMGWRLQRRFSLNLSSLCVTDLRSCAVKVRFPT
jgi:hypothetical protein